MKKSQLLTLVFVLIAGVLAGSILASFVPGSVVAQSISPLDRWDYAAITDLTAVGQGTVLSSITASAKICYFESGCRKRVVDVSIEGSDFEEAKNVVLGRAVARLGQEGWEMIGEATIGFNKEGDRKALYFRRLQR